jgi:hypothetical protein
MPPLPVEILANMKVKHIVDPRKEHPTTEESEHVFPIHEMTSVGNDQK